MTTEYRPNIPSVAHVEAATRLGLLWQSEADRVWILQVDRGRIVSEWSEISDLADITRIVWPTRLEELGYHATEYRPIRPDGTPVDWDVLDQEVARVGQQGQPSAQPQGFRVDLWRRICRHFISADEDRVSSRHLSDVETVERRGCLFRDGDGWQWLEDEGPTRSDILARWTVYQELKPLYDLVDGAQGEAAMPRDVADALHAPYFRDTSFVVNGRDNSGRVCLHVRDENNLNSRLVNFAAVLDAVAERRVAERTRGQTQAPTVTTAQPEPVLDETALRMLILNLPNVASITSRIERGSRQRDRYIVRVQLVDPNVPLDRALAAQIPRNVHVHCEGRGDGGQRGVGGTASSIFSPTGNREDAVAPPIQEPRRVNVEPRRFADVRPDRHGWRWWRIVGAPDAGVVGARFEVTREQWRWLAMADGAAPTSNLVRPRSWTDLDVWDARTVIPTDEQGNPASWESIGPTDPTEIRLSSPQEGSTLDFEQGVDRANLAISQTLVPLLGPPPVGEMTRGVASYDGPVLTIDSVSCEGASGWVTLPGLHDSMRALPRFGLIELDDDDRTGQSRQAPGPALRSGTVPTAAQVAKFRGVLSRKLDNTLADAIKESGISCEISQHVLQRWTGGLGDKEAAEMIDLIVRFETSTKSAAEVDRHAEAILASWSPRFADLGNEPPRPTPSRGELEERRRRLAELQARLRAERAERPAEELQEEPGRMALIEPDPAADPSASIRAWEERQEAAKAAAKLRPGLVTEREREPPRGPAVELVDATRLGSWLGRLYALANTDLPDTRLGARLGPRQRASG